MLTITVGGKAGAHVKPGLAAGDHIEHAARRDPAKDLSHDVRHDTRCRETATGPQTQGHGRVQVTTRDVTYGEGHGQHGQTERQSHTQQAYPHIRESGSQHGTATAPQHQPEGAHKFSCKWFHSHISR
ncbi:hypothetical protein D3C78_1164110 [compost metagenome]